MWSFSKHHNWPKFNCSDTSSQSDWAQKLHYNCSGFAPKNDSLHCAVHCLLSAQQPFKIWACWTEMKQPRSLALCSGTAQCRFSHTPAMFVAQPGPAALAWSGDCSLQRVLREGRRPLQTFQPSPLLHGSCCGNSLFSWPYGVPHHASEVFGKGDNYI